ncbi:MAG: signal recognition particle protein [Planctomycetota bacterium]
MFDRLTEDFNKAFKSLSGRGKISEANVRESMDEVRTALLDADVHYDVVDEFCESVVQEALGQQVLDSLKPGQQMIKVVHDKLVDLMKQGTDDTPGVVRVTPGPTVVMMCGLQGSGKTTTCGKLARYLNQQGRSVMVAAADLQRPAAVEQLQTVIEQVANVKTNDASVEFYAEPERVAEYGKAVGAAVKVCQNALKAAMKAGIDTLILDTAGRLHVNDDLMGELHKVQRATSPHQVMLVVDAMTGQDAVNSAKAFHERLSVDGVILTKFDSDTRGGAALTIKKVTGAPAKFVGTGEKLDALEEFHPERIASRILGMGDVVSLVEKAQSEVSEEEAEQLAEKMARGELTLDDFIKQLRAIRRMGPMKQLLGMLPGVGQQLKDFDFDDGQLDRVEGLVNSMTRDERRDIRVINHSRRKRIADGSGTSIDEVGRLVKQFQTVSKIGQQFAGMGTGGRLKAMKQMASAGGAGGMPGMAGFKGRQSTKAAGGKSFKKRKPKKRR